MPDLRHMTTGEAEMFRAGLRRGVEIGLEAAARNCEAVAGARREAGLYIGGASDCTAVIRALDVATLAPSE